MRRTQWRWTRTWIDRPVCPYVRVTVSSRSIDEQRVDARTRQKGAVQSIEYSDKKPTRLRLRLDHNGFAGTSNTDQWSPTAGSTTDLTHRRTVAVAASLWRKFGQNPPPLIMNKNGPYAYLIWSGLVSLRETILALYL